MEKRTVPSLYVTQFVRIRTAFLPLFTAAALALGCAQKKPEAPAQGELPKVEVWQPGKKLGPEGIPWIGTSFNKQQTLNRMRALSQKGEWEKVDRLSSSAIAYDDKDLLAYGHWFRAILAGRAGNANEAMAHLQVAVKFGFKNADEIASNENLRLLAEREDFIQLVDGLRKQLDRELHEYFEKLVDSTLEVSEVSVPWKPEVLSKSPEPLFAPGTPSIVIVSRTHHDGLPKSLDALRDGIAKVLPGGKSFDVRLILYEYDPKAGGDPAKALERAEQYVQALAKEHAVPERWGMIGHEDFVRLRDALFQRDRAVREKKPSGLPQTEVPLPTFNCFPLMVFLDREGVPVLALEPTPEPWQLEYALRRYVEKVASARAEEKAPAPEPKEGEVEAPPPETKGGEEKAGPPEPKEGQEKAPAPEPKEGEKGP